MSIIKIDQDTYFSTDDGVVVSRKNAVNLVKKAALARRGLAITPVFVRVLGQDVKTLALKLRGRNESITPQRGFLVTVYLQDRNNGALTRLYKDSVVDLADETVRREPFEDYIKLEIDV